MIDKEFVNYFLPDGLLDHFVITEIKELPEKSGKELDIYISLQEKNILPTGYAPTEYESKGFFRAKTIQDFPIRGKAVYLVITRRRWRNKSNKNEVIHNDYSIFAKGTKLTQELSDFLKATGRDPRRYG